MPEKVLLSGVPQKVTVSIGIALYSGIEKHYTELFKKADIALYKVKAERTLKFDIYRDSAL